VGAGRGWACGDHVAAGGAPIIEVCDFYDTVPWHLTSRQVDCYFADPGKRAHRTIRQKMVRIDGFFAFL
jgi:integrase/recombinase XerC